MGYTAEMLASLSDTELDGVVEELILGKESAPGLLPWLGKSLMWKAPEDLGPTTQAGMGRLMEAMLDKGFTIAVAPGGVVWVAGAGRELKYVGGAIALSRAVAIAAVLAVQGAKKSCASDVSTLRSREGRCDATALARRDPPTRERSRPMNAQRCLRTWSMALAVCLLLTAAPRAQEPTPPPPPRVKVGRAAPDFTASYLTAPDANGRRQRQQVRLSDFRGEKHVVLAFFPAAFSPGCTNEMAQYQETSGRFNAHNTVILGMSVDSPWANAAFAEKLGVQFPILSGATRDISRAYGVFDEQNVVARRTTFVIDRRGMVQQVLMAQEALDPSHALEACAVLTEVK